MENLLTTPTQGFGDHQTTGYPAAPQAAGPPPFIIDPTAAQAPPAYPPVAPVPPVPSASTAPPAYPPAAPTPSASADGPAAAKPVSAFPLIHHGEAGFTLEKLPIGQLCLRPDMLLTSEISEDRLDQLASRIKRRTPLPPLIVWRAQDGKTFLVDGIHRLAIYKQLGVKLLSVIVVTVSEIDAILAGLRANKLAHGKLRGGANGLRALTILASKLQRALSPEEAESVGLELQPHQPAPDCVLQAFAVPHFPGYQPVAEKGAARRRRENANRRPKNNSHAATQGKSDHSNS